MAKKIKTEECITEKPEKTLEELKEEFDRLFDGKERTQSRPKKWSEFVYRIASEIASMAITTAVRMTVLKKAPVYTGNALMTANLFALGMALFIFGLFNLIFVGGFFKTAYKQGRPFVIYIIFCFLAIALAESVHFSPGLGSLNTFGFEHLEIQIISLLIGLAAFLLMTAMSFKKACYNFERIDL